jgi:hypothetical protein
VNELGQGLTLSGLGIVITFTALGLLIALILILKWLFPANKNGKQLTGVGSEIKTTQSLEREQVQKLAAAVGVATLIKTASGSTSGNLGKLLEKPVGAWWKKGLDRVHGKE